MRATIKGLDMEWLQFAIFLLTVGGIYWTTRADLNAFRAEATADRRDILQLIRSIEQESRRFQSAMAEEMKDFHGKLERHDAEFKAYLMNHERK